MFDKLDDMLIHYEELMLMLGDPDVTQDTKRFTKLMKEQADLEELSKCVRAIDYGKDRVSSSGTGDAPFVNPVLKIVMLEQEINTEIDKYVDLKRKITGEIQSLQDPQFIKVLFKRYVEYKGFDKIAVELECSERNVYTIHGQALKDFTEKVLKM